MHAGAVRETRIATPSPAATIDNFSLFPTGSERYKPRPPRRGLVNGSTNRTPPARYRRRDWPSASRINDDAFSPAGRGTLPPGALSIERPFFPYSFFLFREDRIPRGEKNGNIGPSESDRIKPDTGSAGRELCRRFLGRSWDIPSALLYPWNLGLQVSGGFCVYFPFCFSSLALLPRCCDLWFRSKCRDPPP